MKYTLIAFVLLSLSACSKKNSDTTTYYLTASINGRTWTTNSVTSENDANFVVISGTDHDLHQDVVLSLLQFSYSNNNTGYEILNTGGGVNPNYSTAYCDTDVYSFTAQSGTIEVQQVANSYILGTFDFTNPGIGHVYGNFKAPLPH